MPNPIYTYILDISDMYIWVNKVKWFFVLLYKQLSNTITNNSIRYQLFVYAQINDQTVLFLTIQFSMSHLFDHILNVKQFYLIHK